MSESVVSDSGDVSKASFSALSVFPEVDSSMPDNVFSGTGDAS